MNGPTLWFGDLADRYCREGLWTKQTIAFVCDRQAVERPDALALSDLSRTVTWSELQTWTDRLAILLVERGLEQGAVVASWLPNSIEHYVVRLACEKAGLVWLPIPVRARAHELLPVLRQSAAALILVAESGHRDYPGEIEALRPQLPALGHVLLAGGERAGMASIEGAPGDGPLGPAALGRRRLRWNQRCFLLPTSGSTGTPKLCEYVMAGTVARGRAQVDLFHLSDEDVVLATVQGLGPSLTSLLAAPIAGAHVVVLDHPTPEVLTRLIPERGVTIVCAVPPVYRDLSARLEAARTKLESVRIWYSTGMALPPGLAAELERKTGGVVISGYGGVDLGCWTSPAPEDPPAVRWFSVGRPRGGSEIRLVPNPDAGAAEGVIEGRGPSSACGYYDDPEATASAWSADGWFRTNDVGAWDGEGNLTLVGRLEEVINRGGDKVYPHELEQLLEQHPQIARAAIVPFSDPRLGERVCAYISPSGGARPGLEDIRAYLEALEVASYKWPERLEVVRELPATSGGKLARQVLRADLQSRLAAALDEAVLHAGEGIGSCTR